MEIAVVGIACRLPGCADVRAFWRRLLDGADCITRFSRADMLADGVPEWLLDDPRYVPAAGYVDDAECFDADFFHLSPADARELDPQQRLLLESAYHALGDAGYAPTNLPGAVSVFAGCGVNSHFWRTLDQADGDPGRQFLAYVANDKDFAATRIAYKLGLSGAAVNVQTACSTSLVAVHLACQNLLLGESDLALAGAATLRMPRRAGYLHVPDGIDSPDGVCRPFDRRAGGTVFSDGVAMLALRRLDEALADGDRVYAVIKGSAVNNDGADKLGFTAPSEAGQTAVVAEALHVAGCRPEDLTFIETHGTGTALGDAVELRALATVFAGSAVRESCALGAVKANIGHTDTVAGAAGLIRAALALYHGVLPPQANFTEPDSDAGLASDAFFVNRGPLDLSDRPHPALAGVSSFGIGGSNAHVVLQAPPRRDRPAQPARPQVFCVAAADPPALERRLDALQQDVAAAGRNLDDVAYTLRRVAGDGPARACQVTAPGEVPFADDSRLVHGSAPVTAPDLGLLLPGQGAQYPGMGRGLYDAFPVYRDTIDEAAAVLRPLLDSDPLHLLFDGDADTLAQTAVTQPLVFATDVAAARLLIAFGLKPSVLLGHSLGEYAAACLADVFDFAAGLRLVAHRGALMQALPPGRMLMVAADVDALDRLPPDVDIAAINAPGSTVISGPAEAVAAAEAALTQAGLTTQPLATSHAYHSAMMAPMIDAFRGALAQVELRPPRVPIVSNLTGEEMTPDEATDPETWCRQLRAPVRFAYGVATLLRRGDLQLLEAGPGRTLASLVRAQTGASGSRPALATFRHPQDRRDDQQVFLETLAAAWVAGASVDWAPLDAQAPAAVTTLPPYPFARERHWLEPRAPATPRPVARPAVDVPDVLVPSWRRAHGGSGDGRLDGRWLIEDTGDGTAPALAEALSRRGAQTQRLAPDKLPAAVRTDQLDGLVLTGSDGDLLQRLAALARAFDARGGATAAERPVTLAWLAQGLFDVTGNERLRPEAAIGLGALRCLPLELPWLACLVADADAPADAAELLAADLASAAPPPMVTYRAGRRWVPTFDVLPGEPASDRPLAGAVLITGGRGGVGRIAVHALAGLAGTEPLDVYLLSRQPPLHEAETAALGRGAVRVHHLSGDVGAPGVVRDAVQRIVATHGRLAGVVHAAGTLAPAGFAPMSGDIAPALALHAPAKRDGTAALATALDETDYDFCLLVSSLSTWLGGVGYGAYAAANAYLDGVAQIKARRGDPWLSVAFDAFAAAPKEAAGLEVDAALDGDAGADAFARAIQAVRHGYAGTALVSATAFAPRWEAWCTAARGQARQTDVAAPATVDTDASPAAVANAAWLDVLGLDDCEPEANFFALGGSSLLALQVLSRLRQICGIEIALADFLATPTLAGLQAHLPTTAKPAEPAAERADRDAPLPVLPGQRRLWAAEQLAGTQPAFAVAAAYRVSGPLDTTALAQAFAALSDRHEALRTRFVAADGEPVQVIDPPGTATAPEWLELSDTTDRQDAIRALAERFFARPFDLAAGPLWRVALAPQGPAEHLLLIAIHHIVVDDWSVGLLLDDLRDFYRDACAGRTPSRVPPSLQFADICVARAKAPTRADELAYWRERLSDLPGMPPLPYDAAPDPASGDGAADGAYEGGLLRLRIDGPQTAALRAAAAARETTPFVWLLSCFEAALFGLGGARTVAVGTPLAGRDEPGTESTVGYFVNPAVLFTHVPTEGSFADMLATVGRCVVEAHANGETPFETIQSTLGLDGPGRRPFHVWFTVLTHAQPRQLGEDLAVEPLYLERRPARFPLALVMEPDGDGLIGHLEYARAAYLPQTAALLAEALQAVLALTLEAPETPLGEIERRCAAVKAAAESRLAESFAGRQRGRLAAARRRPTGTGGTAP